MREIGDFGTMARKMNAGTCNFHRLVAEGL